MKILFVCHRFPFPPSRGGKIRPFNMIRHLDRNHEVTVASLARSPEEAEEGRGIAKHCSRFLCETIPPAAAWLNAWTRLPTATPSSMGYFHSPRLAAQIRREIATGAYDLVLVHCSSVAQYVTGLGAMPRILDFGDMDSQKWLAYARHRRFPASLGFRIEGTKLAREEARLARAFDLSTCTTRAELESLRAIAGGVASSWFPNGVDQSYFAPAGGEYDGNTICFVGRMDYFPNQEAVIGFCRQVLPRLRAAHPSIRLTIVGANPSREIVSLAQAPHITVTGTVPDVRPFVQRSCLTVAPLGIARGTQNKILESLAMGVPVVCSETAAGGVDAVPGEHLLTASDPAGFAEAVSRLIGSQEERERLARAGRRRMETHHAWEVSMRRLDGIIADVVESRSQVAAAGAARA